MAIVAIMILVSISMVSFNVSSENVPGPFADRSTGYPHTTSVDLDPEQQTASNGYMQGSSWSFFLPSVVVFGLRRARATSADWETLHHDEATG